VDWLSVLETKLRGHVELVQDENEDTSMRDEVFQVSELVEPYRVAPSIDLEENSNFRVLMIVLLILTQRSWMLFWALTDKQMSMKMMISILKIVMKVMTIQLTTKKKKIWTNYQNKALCKKHFHVIYIMDDIFCNMKYLFYKFMYCLSTVVIVLCDGQFNNYLKCHYHRHPYRRTNVRRHFTESWKIITWNVTITDGQTSVGISQRVEK